MGGGDQSSGGLFSHVDLESRLWRIVEADLWDRDDLDLVGPALSATTPRNPPQVVEEYPPST